MCLAIGPERGLKASSRSIQRGTQNPIAATSLQSWRHCLGTQAPEQEPRTAVKRTLLCSADHSYHNQGGWHHHLHPRFPREGCTSTGVRRHPSGFRMEVATHPESAKDKTHSLLIFLTLYSLFPLLNASPHVTTTERLAKGQKKFEAQQG
ncbi:hypothetical protein H1C71_004784 [Ictidomys tridecemlineatus]|nr:hypothetical protein H1C71_004784 [Ictidomys tridecemlineatus]